VRVLDALAPVLAAEPQTALQIVGHTDSQGSEMHNLQLSISRAEAVADYLRARGIALDRLSADGRGEADPLTSNAQESGRARNRRVELILHPLP
jgi:outer membrane protein OmpA-like peptidoglycan-associated protein